MDTPFLTYQGASVAVNRADVSFVVYVSSLSQGVSVQFTRDESHMQQILTPAEARLLAESLVRVAETAEALKAAERPRPPSTHEASARFV